MKTTILLSFLLIAGAAAPAQNQMARPNATARRTSCIAPPAGLVSWWPGDTNDNDIVGGNNPTSVTAVSLVPGEVLYGFTFGTGGGILIPASPSLANAQFTWAAWAEPEGPGPNNDAVGNAIVSQDIDNYNDSVALTWRATDNRFLFNFGNVSSETIASTDAFPPAPGTFYFVVATYDGSTFRLYVNGALEGSQAEAKTMQYSSQPWAIGTADPSIASQGYPRTWNGVIDEVQAFNRALSVTQINAIYLARKQGECKGLLLSPSSLTFSKQALGTTSKPKNVMATNISSETITIDSLATGGAFAQTNTCGTSLAPNAGCTISVTFTPSAAGKVTGSLDADDSAPGSPQELALKGTGK